MDRATLQAICDRSGLHRDLSVQLTQTEVGLRLEAVVPEQWMGDQEPAHGGILATLMDTATTFALISSSGHDWSTVDLRVDYLRPVRSKRIWVEAEAVHMGRTLGRATCKLGSETELAAALGVATLRRGENLSLPAG
jgi:uncharacterized protein (TIGR00369 family)